MREITPSRRRDGVERPCHWHDLTSRPQFKIALVSTQIVSLQLLCEHRATTSLRKMMKHSCLLLGVVLLLAWGGGPARADGTPSPGDAGKFLGRTVACGCVAADKDYAFAMYHALLTEVYGSTFANQAMGHMRLALREAYDNQITICGYTCGRDVIPDLQRILDAGQQSFRETANSDAASEIEDHVDREPSGAEPDSAAAAQDDPDDEFVGYVGEPMCFGGGCEDRRETELNLAVSANEPYVDDTGNYGLWQMCYWRPNSPRCKDMDDPSLPAGD